MFTLDWPNGYEHATLNERNNIHVALQWEFQIDLSLSQTLYFHKKKAIFVGEFGILTLLSSGIITE